MTSLCFESALHIAAQLRNRELGAVACLEYFRARVERLNPVLDAIRLLPRRLGCRLRSLRCRDDARPAFSVAHVASIY